MLENRNASWRSRYAAMIRIARIAGALVWCTGVAVSSAANTREYDIKAAFLYRFTAYVEWSTAQSDSDEVFTVGVVGDDRVNEAVAALEQKSVNGRPIAVVRIDSITDSNLEHCHMLFISASAGPELEAGLASLAAVNVLTVGETEGFAERGGVIELRKKKNKISFAINRSAARNAQLRVNARLLDLAVQTY